VPQPAAAHLRSGITAVDYRARVTRLSPELRTAFAAGIYQSDRAIRLDVRSGHSIIVLGYLGERFLRLDARGLAVNAASPTAASTKLLSKAERATAGPVAWRERPGRRSVVWHDARTRGLPSGDRVTSWSIPLLVDGRRASLRGSTERVRRPPTWPLLAACALILVVLLAAMAADRRRPGLLGGVAQAAALVAVTAMIVSAIGFAADRYASGFTWFAATDELALAATGVAIFARGGELARDGAAAGLGLLAIVGAGLGGASLFHGVVLSVLPGPAARGAVGVGLAAGVIAAIAGTVALFSAAERLPILPAGSGLGNPLRR
jgi:hypothetical protein